MKKVTKKIKPAYNKYENLPQNDAAQPKSLVVPPRLWGLLSLCFFVVFYTYSIRALASRLSDNVMVLGVAFALFFRCFLYLFLRVLASRLFEGNLLL